MTADILSLCLRHLDAVEAALLDAQDWLSAAHVAIMIDRLRVAHGLPERPRLVENSSNVQLAGSRSA